MLGKAGERINPRKPIRISLTSCMEIVILTAVLVNHHAPPPFPKSNTSNQHDFRVVLIYETPNHLLPVLQILELVLNLDPGIGRLNTQ